MLSRRVGGCVALCGLLAGRVASLCPHPGESALLPPCAEHLKSTTLLLTGVKLNELCMCIQVAGSKCSKSLMK